MRCSCHMELKAVGFIGEFVSAEGEPVLEEAELSLVMQLKELKNRYRQAYEDFRSTKTEVSYCQHLVNQCRTRLLTGELLWFSTHTVKISPWFSGFSIFDEK